MNIVVQKMLLRIIVILASVVVPQYRTYSTGVSCLDEVRAIYKDFYSSLMLSTDAQKGRYIAMEVEKSYRTEKKPERDTVYTIYYSRQRVKMFNSNFIIHSDGKNYIVIVPSIRRIAIQQIINRNKKKDLNPIEQFYQMADSMFTPKSVVSCTPKPLKGDEALTELVLKPKDYNATIETVQILVDTKQHTLRSVALRSPKKIELKEEKQTYLRIDTNYTLPWDVLCPLEETVYDKNGKPRQEYKSYEIVDIRKLKLPSSHK